MIIDSYRMLRALIFLDLILYFEISSDVSLSLFAGPTLCTSRAECDQVRRHICSDHIQTFQLATMDLRLFVVLAIFAHLCEYYLVIYFH